MTAYGPSRHIALPPEDGRLRGKADIALVASRRRRLWVYGRVCETEEDATHRAEQLGPAIRVAPDRVVQSKPRKISETKKPEP